jgi:hypothetical protein
MSLGNASFPWVTEADHNPFICRPVGAAEAPATQIDRADLGPSLPNCRFYVMRVFLLFDA